MIDGEFKGIHGFIVQLRHLEDHMPMPGIHLGDIGPKVGFNSVDNGFCSFDHVRVPRDHMLMKYAQVTPSGQFKRGSGSSKYGYLTMVRV